MPDAVAIVLITVEDAFFILFYCRDEYWPSIPSIALPRRHLVDMSIFSLERHRVALPS